MNIQLVRSDDPNATYSFEVGECTNFPNIFTAVPAILPADTTIEFCYPEESHVIINSNGECLFQNIHNFMNERNLPLKNFTYSTGNFKCYDSYLIWKQQYKVKGNISFSIKPNHWSKICIDSVPETHSLRRPHKYLNLNNMPWTHRVDIINFLYENNLIDSGLNSFHTTHDDLHEDIKPIIPIIADEIGPNNHYTNQQQTYKNTYFSIVTESVFDRADYWPDWHREGAITEKTYKALFYQHPFVLVGAQGSLEYLRSIGFETFGEFIDESYDTIHNPQERMAAVQHEIQRLCNMTIDDLHAWHHSMHKVYEHNQQLLLYWKSLIPSWQVAG